jgi:CRP-like cAMP-binding protein
METLERVLRDHPFLRELTDAQVHFMTGCARNRRYEAGEFLIREGSEADAMFLLREGRVAIEIDHPGQGPQQVESLGPGDVLGWSWLYPPYRWHIDARAVDRVRAFAFDGTCLRKKVVEDHDLGFVLVKRLLYQAHQRLERVRLQWMDLYRTVR